MMIEKKFRRKISIFVALFIILISWTIIIIDLTKRIYFL